MLSIRHTDYELTLAPELGGAIARFAHRGVPVLRGSDRPAGPLDCACFPLVPYANRIRGGRFTFRGRTVAIPPNMAGDPSPLHGDGWLAPWGIEEAGEDVVRLVFAHHGGDWPWPYRARQLFRLSEAGLEAELSCSNTGAAPMPCGLGFHPYFPCDSATRIATTVATVWEVDENILPTGVAPANGRYALDDTPACARGLDNGYGGWSGTMRLTAEGGAVTTMTSPDASFFQLYSPGSGGLIAAEPVTHANAALNEPEERWPDLGLHVLAPGETMRVRMTLSHMH